MAVIKDSYNTGDDSDAFYIDYDSDDRRRICQTFTTTSAYNATSVKLKVKRGGTVGTIYVSLRATSGGDPAGSNLAVCTYDGDTLSTSSTWVEFVFSTSAPLTDATKYAIVLYAPNIGTSSGDRVTWRYDGGDVGDPATYSGGETGYTNDGITWTVPGRASWVDDAMFEVWAVASGELTVITHACTNTIAEQSIGRGTITDGGASAVTQHGHCWATTEDPTTSDSKTELGASPNLGQFKSDITVLTPSTLYYVRAYAVNGEGTAYGANVEITSTGTIGSREIWEEGSKFHYFGQDGVEYGVQGTPAGGASPYPGLPSIWR